MTSPTRFRNGHGFATTASKKAGKSGADFDVGIRNIAGAITIKPNFNSLLSRAFREIIPVTLFFGTIALFGKWGIGFVVVYMLGVAIVDLKNLGLTDPRTRTSLGTFAFIGMFWIIILALA